jgi:hypothetical protein
MDGQTEKDYPTDEELQQLREWKWDDWRGAIDFAMSLWHWQDFARREINTQERALLGEGQFVRFATGGWSGNESIIYALNNGPGRARLRLYMNGGLYIYEY